MLLQNSPNCLFSALSCSVTLLMFNLLTCGFEPFRLTYQHLSSSWRACYTFKIFIGWGVGRFWRCTVVSSLDISIQSDYSLVFRWNYFSRYTRCRCQVMNMSANTHPSICFRTLLDSRRICWVLLRFCLCNNNDDAQAGSLWRVGGARNCTLGLWLLDISGM